MKLTAYLIRDSITSFDDVIYDRYLSGENAYQEIAQVGKLPFECRALIQANKIKQPRWTAFLADGFDVSSLDLENASNSVVVLLRVEGRILAFTFGYAYNAVDRSKIEPGFGLIVALNSVSQDGLSTIDARNIDLVTRQSRIHVNMGSPIYEFQINTAVDWIKYAAGKPEDSDFANKISGSDSVQLSLDCKLSDLGEVASELLDRSRQKTYESRFPFVAALKKIHKESPEIAPLEEQLRIAVRQQDTDKVAIALPEIPHPDIIEYKLFIGRINKTYSEIGLTAVYNFIAIVEDETDDPLQAVSVIGLDSNGEARTQKRKLHDFFVFEVDLNNQKYVLSLGDWFKVAHDYAAEVRKQVAAISDLTDTLRLPKIRSGENEGAYNERIASSLRMLNLDRTNFTFGSYRDRIEACDLVSESGHLIAVKKMTKSATLSHLFAQASVSARLLKINRRYEQELAEQVQEWRPEIDLNEIKWSFVYAIPTQKAGTLSESMFFFSAVNLLDHVERITLAGFSVHLCKIEYETT